DRVIPLGWVFVGECHWRPGLAQVPDEVAGEQADQHVGFDAVLEAVVDGSQVQVVGLDDAEVAFDVGEVLVAFHHRGGVEALGVDAGAQHVDAVQLGFGVDAGGVAMVGEVVSVMVVWKCLPILYFPIALPTEMPILPAPARVPAATRSATPASSLSVAASRSRRLRARSAASAGLRQAINRSPG